MVALSGGGLWLCTKVESLIYLNAYYIYFTFSTPIHTFNISQIFNTFKSGAIQSAARLKSISAKHLAITAQSLGLILALLPHVRAALLAQLNPKHHVLLTELDRVSHEYIDHHGLLVAKFVSIVGDAVDGSAMRLRQVSQCLPLFVSLLLLHQLAVGSICFRLLNFFKNLNYFF